MPRGFVLFALLLLAEVLPACGPADEPPIRVGLREWPAHEIFHLANELDGIPPGTVELVNLASPNDLVRAFRTGALDLIPGTTQHALDVAAGDQEIRAILVLNFSEGGDAVLARPGIAGAEELVGGRIGVGDGPLGRHMLERFLEHHRLSEGDLTVVVLSLDSHEEALTSGLVDAVITHEPLRGRLVAGGATELFSTRDIPGEVADVLIARRRTIESRAPELRRLLEGWFAARDVLEHDPARAAERIAPRVGRSPEEVLAFFDGLRLPGASENRMLLSGEDPALFQGVDGLVGRLVRDGYLGGPIDPARIFDPGLIPDPEP